MSRAVEQRDAADEGRLETSGSVMVGPFIVNEGQVVRPSQLIASVLRTRVGGERMARRCLTATVLTVVLTMPPISGAEPTIVAFTRQGTAIGLTDAEQAQVVEKARTLMVGCAITSLSDPAIFAGKDLAKEWTDTRAHSHLYVRFAEPVQAERNGVRFQEAAIGFEEPTFLGPELTRYGEEVVGHVKCSGHRALALMCATALRKHLLAGQERACTVYDRIGEPH